VVVAAADVTIPAIEASVDGLIARMEALPSAFFGPFETVISPDRTALYILSPVSSDVDEAEASITALRDDLVPSAFGDVDAEVFVTGFAAANKDFRDFIYGKALYVFGFVLGLAFLLLLVMFRSIVIPIKSILLNLLSVGAAYGVLVMVFQWGWGISLLGSESSGVILSWLPLFLFAILFGLSMDYHMLVLNRVKESWDLTHDNDASVAMGVRLTAGQITSAAAIMVGVFGAFALGRDVGLQQFGIGLGASILIDATIIRSVLLPATMKLLGDWNWYLPRWLEWLPKVSAAEPDPEPSPQAG
jgi:RND superfamily putative drug exporter